MRNLDLGVFLFNTPYLICITDSLAWNSQPKHYDSRLKEAHLTRMFFFFFIRHIAVFVGLEY